MEKIIQEKVYEIKPFKNIIIGDPDYLDEIENGTDNDHLEDLICNFNLSKEKYKKGFVRIKHVVDHSEEYNFDYGFYEMQFAIAPEQEVLEVYKRDRWFGEGKVSVEKELGCDCARFYMNVDGNDDEIGTGADGYYGYVRKNVGIYGFEGMISLDDSLFSFEDVENYAKYFFKIKSDTKKAS